MATPFNGDEPIGPGNMADEGQQDPVKSAKFRATDTLTDWDSALSDALAAVEGLRRDSDIVPALDAGLAPNNEAVVAEQAQLRNEVEDLRAELTVAQQGLARAQAENAQLTGQTATLRRMLQRTETDLPLQATRKLLESLLPALDHLESLTTFMLADEALSPQNREAVEMLEGEWRRALARMQIEPLEAVGQPFDPNLHQMIAQHYADGVAQGMVLRQVHRGYTLQGKLVRSAAVVVRGPKPPTS